MLPPRRRCCNEALQDPLCGAAEEPLAQLIREQGHLRADARCYLQLPPHFEISILPSVLTSWNQPVPDLPANLPVPPMPFHTPLSAPAAWENSMLCVSPSLSFLAQ